MNWKIYSLFYSYKNSELWVFIRSFLLNNVGFFRVIILMRILLDEFLGFKIKGGCDSDSVVCIFEVDENLFVVK